MYEVQDLSGRTRAAIIAVTVWLLTDLAYSISNFLFPDWDSSGALWVGLLGGISLLALIVSIVLVARWIYRASANAHARSGDLEITPGWAVGWYFIPIANLFKPFQAMKEIWFEATGERGGYGQSAPAELVGWWTLWIITNIINNIVFRMEMSASADLTLAATLTLISSVLAVPMTYLLVTIMRRVDQGQDDAGLQRVFS